MKEGGAGTGDVQIETSLEHGMPHFLQLVIRPRRANVGRLLKAKLNKTPSFRSSQPSKISDISK